MHPRAAIRRATADTLTAALAGVTVDASRVYDYRASDLPAVGIYTPSESINLEQSPLGPAIYRELSVEIEIRTRLTGDFADEADNLADQVEAALEAAGPLDDLTTLRELRGTDVEVEGGDKPHCLITLRYQFDYLTP